MGDRAPGAEPMSLWSMSSGKVTLGPKDQFRRGEGICRMSIIICESKHAQESAPVKSSNDSMLSERGQQSNVVRSNMPPLPPPPTKTGVMPICIRYLVFRRRVFSERSIQFIYSIFMTEAAS